MGTTDNGTIESLVDSIIAPDESTETEEEVLDESQTETEDEVDVDSEDEFEEDDEYEDEVDDTDEEDEFDEIDDAGPEEPKLITVRVDGEDVQVTLDDLKQGYSGQAYVQKGMAEAAKLRKEAEARTLELQQQQEQVSSVLKNLQSGNALKAPTPPSMELAETDPFEYTIQRAQYEEAKSKYETDVVEARKVLKQQEEAQKREFQQLVQREGELLKQHITDFTDQKTAKETWDKMVVVGQEYGFEPGDLNSVTDHRTMRMWHDAMKYRELMAGKKKVQKKTKSARPVVKPGAKKRPNTGKRKTAERRKARLKATGSIKDAVSMIMEN